MGAVSRRPLAAWTERHKSLSGTASRPSRTAEMHGFALATAILITGLAGVAALVAPGLHAQEPPDTTVQETDSLPPGSPTEESLAEDTVVTDSVPPPLVLPVLPDPAFSGRETGIWEWNRTELLGARGQTLWELLSGVPGIMAVRSGDFGSSATAFPVGYSGGGLRVYWDGVEHLPMEGSVPDLSRVPLSGLQSVRVVRRLGGLEVHLSRFVHDDVRAYSLIEAGTGDQDTNVLRGTFSLARAFRGKASLAIERLDTRGRGSPGAVTGGWFRYSLHKSENAGLRFEIRRVSSERTDSAVLPTLVNRSDWTLAGSWRVADGIVAQAWATGASLSTGDTASTSSGVPVNPTNPSSAGFPFSAVGRRQYGGGLTAGRGPFWGRITARLNRGAGVVDRDLSIEASALSERWGGGNVRLWREAWDGEAGTGYDMRLWASPVSYATLFLERGSGRRSVPFLKPLPPPADSIDDQGVPVPGASMDGDPPGSRFSRRSGTRYGLRARWRSFELAGARFSVETDSVWPTLLPFDRDGMVLAQGGRSAWEVMGSVPLWPRGLALLGHAQLWEAADSGAIGSLYLPDHVYQASLSFHRTFLATGNFELWVDLGVQGRSAMAVPLRGPPAGPDTLAPTAQRQLRSFALDDETEEEMTPAVVPFYQNWYFRLQVRIITVHIFATVENLAARPANQDFPGRLLPATRGLYGVRWTLWN